MIITKVEMVNFGPYYGKKIVKFNRNGYGIHIIHGETGRGKTSFQSAILWALYGEPHIFEQKNITAIDVLNNKAKEDGDYHFGVKIYFTHDGKKWILTRKTKAKTLSNKSFNANEKLILTKEGEPLSNPQLVINRILPPEVKQFFFFDGEMLKKYEILLEADNPSKRELKNAIEKILGIPFISTAKHDLEQIKKHYEKEIRKIFERIGTDDDREITKMVEEKEIEKEEEEKALANITAQLKEVDNSILERKSKEEEYESIKNKVTERNNLEKEQADLEKQLEKLKRKRGDLLRDIYKYTLYPIIKAKIGYVNRLYDDEFKKWERKTLLKNEIARIKEQISKNICPCCGSELNHDKILHLKEELSTKEVEFKKLSKEPIPNMSIEHMKERLERVMKITENANGYISQLESIENEINIVLENIAEKEKQIEDLSKDISSTDEEEIKTLEKEIRELEAERGRLEKEKEDLETEIENIKREIIEGNAKLSKIKSTEIKELKKRVEHIEYIISVFEKSIDIFREKKRKEVEKVASEIFSKIKTKEGFESLVIDRNYGLRIKAKDGELYGLKSSAGEEEIIAFCLIGALNKCSSVKAPTFMDAAFVKIDVKHTKNILRYLPKLSEQIVLLVTSKEFKDEDKKEVAEHIVTELELINEGYKEGTTIRYYENDERNSRGDE